MEKRTVLFVDDEEKVLTSLKCGLLDEPYETLFAKSGNEALEIIRQHEVHVIVTDIRMPEMSGLELLKIVRKEFPHIIRIALSGYAQIDTLLTAINEGEIFRFITKPWKLNEELKTVIRQAIDFYDLHNERLMLMTFFEQLMDGIEPEKINFKLIQMLIAKRKKHLYEWAERCAPVSPK
jgi:two-component system response regulator HupR/HoxA